MFHMHNVEGMLLQISAGARAYSSMFSSRRTQVSHRTIAVSLGTTIHLNLRSSFFSRPPRRSAAQPLPSRRCGCALVAAVHQGWWVSTTRQVISDLVCSSAFIASKFLPFNSTVWCFPRRENMDVNGDGWLWFLRTLFLAGWSWCKEKEKNQRQIIWQMSYYLQEIIHCHQKDSNFSEGWEGDLTSTKSQNTVKKKINAHPFFFNFIFHKLYDRWRLEVSKAEPSQWDCRVQQIMASWSIRQSR